MQKNRSTNQVDEEIEKMRFLLAKVAGVRMRFEPLL